MNVAQPPAVAEDNKGLLNTFPAWGSYLYQNFLLPAFSPSEWLNTNTPLSSSQQQQQQPQSSSQSQQPQDYFGQYNLPVPNKPVESAPPSYQPQHPTYRPLPVTAQTFPQHPHQHQQQQHGGPSAFYPQPYYPSSIPTSLLVSQNPSSSSSAGLTNISPSLDVADTKPRLVLSPSPISSVPQSPRGLKRRASSLDTDDHEHSHDEQEEVPEGVERDGMIWGMRVDDYRALSARERKRVRNRISARTFRAKRKEHLSSLETTLAAKDLAVKLAIEESSRLRKELAEVKKRLAKYERA